MRQCDCCGRLPTRWTTLNATIQKLRGRRFRVNTTDAPPTYMVHDIRRRETRTGGQVPLPGSGMAPKRGFLPFPSCQRATDMLDRAQRRVLKEKSRAHRMLAFACNTAPRVRAGLVVRISKISCSG